MPAATVRRLSRRSFFGLAVGAPAAAASVVAVPMAASAKSVECVYLGGILDVDVSRSVVVPIDPSSPWVIDDPENELRALFGEPPLPPEKRRG